jgi:hypothetical protein
MKRGKKKERKLIKKKRGIKHHSKLLLLLGSKIIIAFVAFLIGLYIGSFAKDTYVVLFIAFTIACVLYLLSIVHVVKWLKI